MRIEFEYWVTKQNFNKTVMFLFEESFKSYRGQAFSAALMYTHLAFYESIKQKIRRVKHIPDGIKEIEWQKQYIDPILNDDTWDAKIYTLLSQKQDSKTKRIFNLSESIQDEISYWKNKRNTAVHFRNEKINFFHVESYWNFIESNFSKINVMGSKTSFLNNVEDYFNTDLTSVNESFDSILNDFSSSFDSIDNNFFEKIIDSCLKNPNNKWTSFVNSLIKTNQQSLIIDQVNQYFDDENNIEILYNLLRNDSYILRIIKLEHNIVRILWRKTLFSTGLNDFYILVQLIKNYDYLNLTLNEIYEHIFEGVVAQEIFPDDSILKELGEDFKNCFSTKLFEGLNQNWDFKRVNRQTNYILHFLQSFPIEDFWIECILEQLNAPYKPQDFIPRFRELIAKNENIKNSFQKYILLNSNFQDNVKLYFFTTEQLIAMKEKTIN